MIKLISRKAIICILCLTMLLGMSATVFAQEGSFSNSDIGILTLQYRVTADVLNVRSGPGLSYSKVGKLYEGDVVLHDPTGDLTYADGYYWTKIYKDNGAINGWVVTDYIENIS